jgi:hypothetical protein
MKFIKNHSIMKISTVKMAKVHSEGRTYAEKLAERPAVVPVLPAKEKYVILSSGGGAATWTGRIVDKISYNWYHVCPVCIGEPGSLPVGLGTNRIACNLGENFLQQGTLPAYTYVVFWHVGDHYVFCREP